MRVYSLDVDYKQREDKSVHKSIYCGRTLHVYSII